MLSRRKININIVIAQYLSCLLRFFNICITMELNQRIQMLIDYKGDNASSFATAIGAKTKQAIYELLKGNTKSLSQSMTNNIISYIPEVNITWLLTGEGDMIAKEQPQTVPAPATATHGNLIPFYDAQTSGGYEGRVASSAEVAVVEGYIDAGGWFGGRETAAIRHVGDSMAEYPDGCILAVREVLDARLLVPGKVYVVETSEYRVTKRYQRGSTAETIALYSSNEERYPDGRLVHEPFEVLKEDVRHIFLVLGYIVNQSGEIRIITPNA